MIGTTNFQRGLYVIDSAAHLPTCNSVTNNSCNIWHLRLGYITDIGLQTMSKLFPFINCNKSVGLSDSCHFVKERKFPFPNSITHSSNPFNIFHVDLWGPFSKIFMLGQKYFLTLVYYYTRYT